MSSLRRRLLHQRHFRELLIVSVVIAFLLGLVIVPVERDAQGATIKTVSDGLWWSVQTLTTVGYGDTTPITDAGRVIGVAMQVIGAVLFGTVIAIIGSSMSRGQEEFYWNRLFERLDRSENRLSEMEKKIEYMVRQDASGRKEKS